MIGILKKAKISYKCAKLLLLTEYLQKDLQKLLQILVYYGKIIKLDVR